MWMTQTSARPTSKSARRSTRTSCRTFRTPPGLSKRVCVRTSSSASPSCGRTSRTTRATKKRWGVKTTWTMWTRPRPQAARARGRTAAPQQKSPANPGAAATHARAAGVLLATAPALCCAGEGGYLLSRIAWRPRRTRTRTRTHSRTRTRARKSHTEVPSQQDAATYRRSKATRWPQTGQEAEEAEEGEAVQEAVAALARVVFGRGGRRRG